MKKIAACALAVLSTLSTSAFAESVDVRVIGTITPTACTPTLSGGGTIDYGAINPNTLSATAYTVLPERQLDFSITCDAPAKVALRAINGRPASLAGATEGAQSAGRAPVNLFNLTAVGSVGLGLDGTSMIGGYGIRIAPDTVTADGIAVTSLRSLLTGTTWTADAYAGILYDPANAIRITSWGATGTTTPIAFTTLAGKLGVQAYINHSSNLDLTKPVALNGLTTIELVYL
ncbi:Beta-fimbriae probable major subunit [Pseudomonas chlororaphis subsp. aurantiaca]|uniref:DUF1120 domain-containing protein n=1 Tax=Pseudomonas chlororaphis TaxID=587753 RepID=UPI000F576BB5|nr:DUF1120 domain-containing protein [Pseudomonas chlororaphis]AZD55534.1 Beta-fimbriae probable major subunit [Pseudomonas chlororaphis subsp. aurantiaca]